MLKKVSLKKLAQMAKEGNSKGITPIMKGITIGEKRPRDEMPDISPTKKGKQSINGKKKRLMPSP